MSNETNRPSPAGERCQCGESFGYDVDGNCGNCGRKVASESAGGEAHRESRCFRVKQFAGVMESGYYYGPCSTPLYRHDELETHKFISRQTEEYWTTAPAAPERTCEHEWEPLVDAGADYDVTIRECQIGCGLLQVQRFGHTDWESFRNALAQPDAGLRERLPSTEGYINVPLDNYEDGDSKEAAYGKGIASAWRFEKDRADDLEAALRDEVK